MSGAGTLAKVAGTVAAGYMMSKAINKQTKAMQQMPGQMNGYPGGGYPGGGYPGGGYPGGGYPGGGYPGGGYPYPGGGYPYPTNNYPMGANMAGSSMMGATVMNGLNALLMNH